MTVRIIVVGVGLEGLLASWVFRQHPHLDVWAIGRPPVGGDYQPGSMVDPWHSESLGNLLRELSVPYASFYSRNGIMLRGNIEDYPRALKRMKRADATRIFRDVQLKARVTPHKLNGELRRKSERRLRCDVPDLIRALMQGSGNRVVPVESWRIEPGVMRFGRRGLAYDFALITEPLDEVRRRVWFRIPPPSARGRHTALVVPRSSKRYAPWDQVLTPYTPGGAVHKVATQGHAYSAEINGALSEPGMLSDLNFIFPDGYDLRSVRSDDAGTLEPLTERVRWPENFAALGAAAEWRDGATLDEVLDGAYELMRRWLR